ncbi:MAG: AAA family ATPase [Candidatus Woesearchaeota archaeon]
MEIAITAEELARERLRLDDLVNSHSNAIRNKLNGNEKSVESIYGGFAVAKILWQMLVKEQRVDKVQGMAAAVCLGANYGLHVLGVNPGDAGEFSKEVVDYGKPFPVPLNELLGKYSAALDYCQSVDGLTRAFFSWMRGAAEQTGGLLAGIKGEIADYAIGSVKSGKTWADFGGYEHAVAYLKDIALLIEHYDEVEALRVLKPGEILPRGILFYGPPGTGKSSLAMIFCYEVGIPFFMVSKQDFADRYKDGSCLLMAEKCREAEEPIRKKTAVASVLYFDELDSVVTTRSDNENAREDNKVVTTLGLHMDGPNAVDRLIFMASTNRPDIIDQSLLRPGRFSVMVYMGLPSLEGLKEIFPIYLRGADVDVDAILGEYAFASDVAVPERAVVWSGAFVKELVMGTKRRKVLDYLKSGSDYHICTGDMVREIEFCKKGSYINAVF